MTNSTDFLIDLKHQTKGTAKIHKPEWKCTKADTALKPREMLFEKTEQIYIIYKNSLYTPTSYFNLNSDQTYKASFCLCYQFPYFPDISTGHDSCLSKVYWRTVLVENSHSLPRPMLETILDLLSVKAIEISHKFFAAFDTPLTTTKVHMQVNPCLNTADQSKHFTQ